MSQKYKEYSFGRYSHRNEGVYSVEVSWGTNPFD